jgi:NSS family neurotransmitter:Na+ symporter
MPLGNLFLPLFFVLGAIAATGAMLSLLEVPVAFLNEKLGWSRLAAALAVIVVLGLVGSTAALSNSLLANFKLFGMTMFDLYDYVTSNILLPVGGICLAIFVGWVWGYEKVKTALTNQGGLHNQKVIRAFFLVLKIVTPVLILLVLLQGLKLI